MTPTSVGVAGCLTRSSSARHPAGKHRPRPGRDAPHVRGIAADCSRRTVEQIDQQQHAIAPLERLRPQRRPNNGRVSANTLTSHCKTDASVTACRFPRHRKNRLLSAWHYADRYRFRCTSASNLINELAEAADEDRMFIKLITRRGRVGLFRIDELRFLSGTPRYRTAPPSPHRNEKNAPPSPPPTRRSPPEPNPSPPPPSAAIIDQLPSRPHHRNWEPLLPARSCPKHKRSDPTCGRPTETRLS